MNKDSDNWDDCIPQVLFEQRTKPLRATGFSPSEMFHTWKIDRHGSSMTDAEEDELLLIGAQDDESSSNVIKHEWQSYVERFAEVQERVRNAAEVNISKEKLRQKKSYDLRHLNHGEEVRPGRLSRKYRF